MPARSLAAVSRAWVAVISSVEPMRKRLSSPRGPLYWSTYFRLEPWSLKPKPFNRSSKWMTSRLPAGKLAARTVLSVIFTLTLPKARHRQHIGSSDVTACYFL
jgi:hypothetical protein